MSSVSSNLPGDCGCPEGFNLVNGECVKVETTPATYTGQTVELTVQRHFDVDAGAYTYTFQDFKTRGWFSPTVPPAIWTEVA